MVEEASEILEYLPLRRSQIENDYIAYLWSSFERLATSEDEIASSFSITAFHLLFMLAVQYKAMRLYSEKPEDYKRSFTLYKPRQGDERVISPTSVFDLSLLQESSVFHLFEIVGIDIGCIKNCKIIIRNRNNEFMHASGNSAPDVSGHITNCLGQLAVIQSCFTDFNDVIANNWSFDLTAEDNVTEFVDLRLFDTQLTKKDFASGNLETLFGFAL